MMGRNHIVLGVATTLILKDQLFLPHTLGGRAIDPLLVLLGGVVAAMAGSLVPDIDHGQSAVAHRVGIAQGHGYLTDSVFGPLRRRLGGHRALTHSLWAVLVLVFVFGLQFGEFTAWGWILWLGWPGLTPWGDVGTAFTLGYAVHIVADLLTKEGVKFWYPLRRDEVGLGPKWLRLSTGSLGEYAVVVLAVAAALWRWFA